MPGEEGARVLLDALDTAVLRHARAEAGPKLAVLSSESPSLGGELVMLDHPRPDELARLAAWLLADEQAGALRVGTPADLELQLLSPGSCLVALSISDGRDRRREVFLREQGRPDEACAVHVNLGDGPPYKHHVSLDSRHQLPPRVALRVLSAFAVGAPSGLALGGTECWRGAHGADLVVPSRLVELAPAGVSRAALESGTHPMLDPHGFPFGMEVVGPCGSPEEVSCVPMPR